MYKCICGKEFDKPNSFNAHKSHCKEHFINKYGSDKEFISLNKKRGINAGKTLASKAEENKLIQNNKWVNEKHICEKCGKIMTKKFGSGRFCSQTCANIREFSEETKQKIGNSVKTSELFQNSVKQKHVQGTFKKFLASCKCKACGKQLASSNKSGYCSYCLYNTEDGKATMSARVKAGQERAVAEGKHVGWQSRDLISYPEQFWMQVLTNNNIDFQHEYKIQRPDGFCYFLDFVIDINGIKIDLEIDGAQHKKPERKKSDEIRDAYLSRDYLIYRIEWNEINTISGSNLMKEKINQFLDFYYKQ